MARSKRPRRHYSRTSHRKQHQPPMQLAAACHLFYWTSANLPTGTFGHGSTAPISRRDQARLLRRAMNRPTQWVVIVASCFLDAGGADYSEAFDSFVTGLIRIGHDDSDMIERGHLCTEQLHDDIQALIHATRDGGNTDDYEDTVVILRPASAAFAKLADDPNWWQAQAEGRERQLRKRRLEREIARLQGEMNTATRLFDHHQPPTPAGYPIA